MRITQWGEYAIHCCITLARNEGEGSPTVGAVEIAREQDIAPEYAQQILQRLRRGKIIASVRGPLGGYRLARPASEITLLDILNAAEGEAFEMICETRPLSPERCGDQVACRLRELWEEFRIHVNDFLLGHRLSDLVEGAPESLVQLRVRRE